MRIFQNVCGRACLCLLCMVVMFAVVSCASNDTVQVPQDIQNTADNRCNNRENPAQETTVAEESETTAAITEAIESETLIVTEAGDTEEETVEITYVDPAVYFENNLFVGDSILEGLAQYVRAQRQNGVGMLSDAKFLTSIMGIRVADLVGDTADYERIRYQYRGAVRELSEIVELAAPKRLFLLVGMNDLAGGASMDDTIVRYERLLTQLKTAFPTLEIVVMTPTPKTASEWLPNYCTNPDFGSPLLRTFADQLIALCETLSVPCMDIFAALADENGHLPDNFSRDNYVHINDLGSAVVVDALNRFAQEGSVS